MPSDNSKNIKTRNILSLVKLGSIIIISIIIIKNSTDDNALLFVNFADTMMFLLKLFFALAVTVIYYIWSYVFFERINPKNINIVNIIESIIFLLIFMGFIWLTGKNESHYKIIFLFIIIPVSIQFGFKFGFLTAGISSLFILTMDLLLEPNEWINMNFENDIIISAIFIVIAWLLSYYVKIEHEHSQMLEEKANTDVLTDLNNHRFFYDRLQNIFESHRDTLSLIFFDIDYFKDYNDMFGHLRGDVVLKQIGKKIKEILKGEAVTIARYGGDEFAIILHGIAKEKVYEIGERIRVTIEEMYFEGQEHLTSKNLTVSMGIAICDQSIKGYIDLIKRADDALYKAKFTRKNKVEIFDSVYSMIKTNVKEDHFDIIASIKTLISVINSKDKYTFGHVERVVRYADMLADKLKLTKKQKKILIYGAYIHDIGKLNIPEYILNKKMPLTDDEWDLIKQHPSIGVEIISKVEYFEDVIPLVKYHHERYDGRGYPDGLQGKDIPYLARVLTVVDSFDAMTFSRTYKHAMTYDEAIVELERCSGTQFDPQITRSFIETIRDLNKQNT